MESTVRLAEILGALSLTTDLGAGVPFEKGLRTCAVATIVADELGVRTDDRRSVYFAALLRSLGCTAHASTFAELLDDDVAVQRALKTLHPELPGWEAAQTEQFASWAGSPRARELTARLTELIPVHGRALATGSCEVSATLGTRLGLPAGAIRALDEVYERYDGRGFPTGRGGDELSLTGRIVHAAEQVVMADYEGGPAAIGPHVDRLAGGHLDPDVCRAVVARGEEIAAVLAAEDMLDVALAREPQPPMTASTAELDRVCVAFAAFADLKGRFLLGHSSRVAELAAAGFALDGQPEPAVARLRASALLQDLGRVGVSSAVWDRPGRLSPVEWERVRLHPYWTERILSRCPGLERLAPPAAAHHERLDGSGYHRGAGSGELSAGARTLAAADAFAAITEDRPHRPGRSVTDAAAILADEVTAGRLDGAAVAAVVEAAGLPRRRTHWPSDLTDREVEVLRVLARGHSNREIAEALVLSPRTVQHHLASIYAKIGLHTRAGAAVFAIEHGLVPASEPS